MIKTSIPVLILWTAYFLTMLLMLAVHASAQMRVVAVGDSHGAYPEFVTILQRVGLIDGNRQWIGGSSVLVQTGDVIDRGKQSRECLDLLMDLERQAPKQNGRVIPLLGNHEVMNIMGDLRYVVARIIEPSRRSSRKKGVRRLTAITQVFSPATALITMRRIPTTMLDARSGWPTIRRAFLSAMTPSRRRACMGAGSAVTARWCKWVTRCFCMGA